MKPLSQHTNTFTDSVIRRMTRISQKYGAVNLSHGVPDFEPPKAKRYGKKFLRAIQTFTGD